MRVVIWGGAGRIGRCLTYKISRYYDYIVLDVHNMDKKEEILRSADVLVNCLPFYMNEEVISWIQHNPIHYFDLSEDSRHTTGYDWDSYPKKFVPHCGLAPGLINIMAANEMKKFDKVFECSMRVGALPRMTTNMFKYHCTWSPDGLINEYRRPCKSIRNYESVLVPPMDDLEQFSIDGTEYEAFNTSGGIGTMVETYKGQVAYMNYKSIRYPGHLSSIGQVPDLDAFRTVVDDGYDGEDMVITALKVRGTVDGKPKTSHRFEKYYSNEFSAIQSTTAEGAMTAIALAMVSPKTGWIRQEELTQANS
jgi:saccharopine dehydrogenase-like NADP-dependent oxidoreductase